jgi:hypothetical protein
VFDPWAIGMKKLSARFGTAMLPLAGMPSLIQKHRAKHMCSCVCDFACRVSRLGESQ